MGLCVDADETKHGIAFEVRRESVAFFLTDGGGDGVTPEVEAEIGKEDLARIKGLLCDDEWTGRLLPPNDNNQTFRAGPK